MRENLNHLNFLSFFCERKGKSHFTIYLPLLERKEQKELKKKGFLS
jgi:hypothetical protein